LSMKNFSGYGSASIDHAALQAFHQHMHETFRATETGTVVEYLGKEFVLHRNVFWPGDDSRALVENYVVRPGEEVLDVCTGSGLIAVFSGYKGAESVVALDRNPDAVENARDNAGRHGFADIIEVRESDMFSALEKDRKFDVITMNPPFEEHVADDLVSGSTWDEGLHVHKEFFAHSHEFLKPNGRSYIAAANFGPIDEMLKMARDGGYTVREIGKHRKSHTTLIFYAFELQQRGRWSQ
jgi:release factor glutamine methyltransferase